MKQKVKKKHPCRPWWITAGILTGLGLLVPTYFYVRLLPVLAALIITLYCLIFHLKKKHPKAAKVLRWILTVGVIMGVLVFVVTGSFILRAGRQIPHEPIPYVAVLGARVHDYGPSASLQERIDTAYDYLTAHPDTVAILSGGQGNDEPVSEAQCMYDRLTERGISPERLLMEDRSTSTWLNLSYSLDLIEAETGSRPSRLGVISSEYHLFRTGLQAREYGLEVIGIPAKTGSFDRWLHYFVREIAGVWHYLLLGGQTR
jgi:uncharacterized SAM-binding protein YcdF (DUF218 family)